MELRRLQAFVAVADLGTISKAAATLRLTQPAVSRQIQGLERQIGFALFERIGQRLRLTARGEAFLDDCRSLLAHAATITEQARALHRGDLREIRVVVAPLTMEVIPAFLRRYAERVPGVRLTLIEARAAQHLALLESGAADLAISIVNLLQVDEDHFVSHPLQPFHLLALFAPTLAITSSRTVDIGKVVRHPLLLLNAAHATRNVFDAACSLAGVGAKALIESESAQALIALAQAGQGVAILPSLLQAVPPGLHTARVTLQREPLRLMPAVISHKARIEQRYVRQFAELLVELIGETYPSQPPRRRT
jgi:LysR family transcriptional regulator, nitrogen assimilation regulatory protein